MRIEVLLDLKTRLGESPVWDVEQQRLWWVDSLDGRLFACNAQGGAIKSWDVRQKIGSFALRQNGEGAVVALQNGVHLLDFASGELTLLHHPEADRPFNRLNDGKVDRQGRFLFGSMDMREEEPSGALYRLDADLSLHVLKKISSSLTPPAGAPPARRSILPIPGRAKSAPGTTTPRPAISPANESFAMSIAAKAARRMAPPWTAKAICGTRWSTRASWCATRRRARSIASLRCR
jgi:hypothetical protein